MAPLLPTATALYSLIYLAGSLAAESSGYPSRILLRAGVVHSPPFAYIDYPNSSDQDEEPTYRGFMVDLVDRLKVFAAEDNVDLQVELSPSPEYYTDAFELVTSDCHVKNRADCQKFDMILGDFYSNPERSMRANLSPPWLRSTTTTLKYLNKTEGSPDYTTLREAEEAKATVCVPRGTFMQEFAWSKYPGGNYIACDHNKGECIRLLKNENCKLYVYDELILHNLASIDHTLQVTRESFNTQYMVWPLSESMPAMNIRLIHKWIYKAVQNNTLDELYFDYFQNQLCPQGTAGPNCELPCDPDHGKANSKGVCVCQSAKFTGDDCSIEIPEELNLLPTTIVWICYGMAGSNFALVAVCALWLWWNWNRSQVKIAQPVFLVLILIGSVFSTSSIFAMAQEDPGDGPVYSCAALPWLYSIGFSITFGSLFARIRRIYYLLQCALEMKRVTISARETMMTVAVILGIDVVILVAWTISDPLQWTREVTDTDVFGEPLESIGYCESDHWQIFVGLIATFHLLLMIVACIMSYWARAIPDRISHGKYVAIAMFSNLQIFVLSIPLLVLLAGDPVATFFMRSAAIWINDFVVVGLLFGNLIFKVHHRKFDPAVQSSQKHIKQGLNAYLTRMKRESGLKEGTDHTKATAKASDRSLNIQQFPCNFPQREDSRLAEQGDSYSFLSFQLASQASQQGIQRVASMPPMDQIREGTFIGADDEKLEEGMEPTTTPPVDIMDRGSDHPSEQLKPPVILPDEAVSTPIAKSFPENQLEKKLSSVEQPLPRNALECGAPAKTDQPPEALHSLDQPAGKNKSKARPGAHSFHDSSGTCSSLGDSSSGFAMAPDNTQPQVAGLLHDKFKAESFHQVSLPSAEGGRYQKGHA